MSNDLFSLNGKVALVTGSSTGLGKVMATGGVPSRESKTSQSSEKLAFMD